jgi:Gamma tubulin complex component C-terminal
MLIVDLSYGNTVALEQSIDKAYLATTSKLVELMKSKFGFWDHLNAFKKYILLGQGDFIALLMESIGYLSISFAFLVFPFLLSLLSKFNHHLETA